MINKSELREGNYVLVNVMGCENFSSALVRIASLGKESIEFDIDYPDSPYIEGEDCGYEGLLPLPLNQRWRSLLRVDFEYPSWIKSVHELQNWYYWDKGRRELDVSDVPQTEGDNIPLEYFEELAN